MVRTLRAEKPKIPKVARAPQRHHQSILIAKLLIVNVAFFMSRRLSNSLFCTLKEMFLEYPRLFAEDCKLIVGFAK